MARQRRTGIELASLLECSQQSASKRLTGTIEFRVSELEKIADWLAVPMHQLMPLEVPA